MYTVNKLIVETGKVEEIELGTSAMMYKLEELGYAKNGLLKVAGNCEVLENADIVASKVAHYAHKGIQFGDDVYVPFCAGSSDIRKATSVYLNQKIYKEIWQWAMCGLDPAQTNIDPNKYSAYIGLLLSNSHPMETTFGKTIDIDRVAVVKDYKTTLKHVVDEVNGDMEVEHDVDFAEELNVFDGQALIQPEFTNGELATLRAPWQKLLAIPFDFHKFCKDRNITTFVDYYNVTRNIEDIDLIVTESTFKTCKFYKSFEDYAEAFKKFGHKYFVCVREHGYKLTSMPYQQTQSLVGANKSDVEFFGKRSSDMLNDYKNIQNAPKLLGKELAKICTLHPELMKDSWIANRMQEAYSKKRGQILGGAIQKICQYAFVSSDPVAMMQAICNKPVIGMLKAGECHCSQLELGEVDTTRCPSLDTAHVIMNNVNTEYDEYLNKNAIYTNIYDDIYFRLRMDVDGDHLNMTQQKEYLEMVKRSLKETKNITPSWNVPKSTKQPFNGNRFRDFIGSLCKESMVGMYSDCITRMFATVDIKED